MKTLVKRFAKDELGATAIEYGLIAAGISVAIITVVQRPRHQAEHDVQQRQHQAELIAIRVADQKGSGSRRSLFILMLLKSIRSSAIFASANLSMRTHWSFEFHRLSFAMQAIGSGTRHGNFGRHE